MRTKIFCDTADLDTVKKFLKDSKDSNFEI